MFEVGRGGSPGNWNVTDLQPQFSHLFSPSPSAVSSKQGFNELDSLLRKKEICIALREKLLKDSGVPTDQDYDRIVLKLLEKELARGKKSVRHFKRERERTQISA
ncbi:hypothetical protein Btru_033403 [Bulinus truncatus]|nr:hypothetical protein Btru_033403 [Bulinus truncatus]